MPPIAFDTLKFVETLIVAGMPAEQAKALSEVQKEVFQEVLDGVLATKADIHEVKTALKAEIQEVRTELKAEIQQVRTELKAEIQEVRTELKAEIKVEIAEVRSEIRVLKWMMGFLLTGMGALLLKAFF